MTCGFPVDAFGHVDGTALIGSRSYDFTCRGAAHLMRTTDEYQTR
jgi:hypothetical protein